MVIVKFRVHSTDSKINAVEVFWPFYRIEFKYGEKIMPKLLAFVEVRGIGLGHMGPKTVRLI